MDIFTPFGLATVNIGATNSTANVALNTPTAPMPFSVRVHNAGSAIVFINFGASTVEAAAASSMPIPGNAVEVFELGRGVTHVAAIVASGTHTIYFTTGRGA